MKYIYLAFLVTFFAGCVGSSIRDTDPFRNEYTPIAGISVQEPDVALSKVVELLEHEGYLVSSNAVFYVATTDPKSIGYQYWRVTNEKWKVSYQLGVQIMKATNGVVYWKLSHKIVGSRSGKQNRLFEPSDFEVTESVVNEISRKLMKLFSTHT